MGLEPHATHDATAAAAKDEGALWAAFAAPLRAFVRKRLPDGVEADDVLQEIFLRIARHAGSLDEVEHLEGWIHRVARSALADALRAHGRREAHLGAVDVDTLPDGSAEAPASALAELSPCVAPFVRRLDEPYRSALEMTAFGGISQQEAAARAGISLSGMKSRVQRAREQVRRQLLRCCRVELDARGSVMDYERRDDSACGPSACGCVPSGDPAS